MKQLTIYFLSPLIIYLVQSEVYICKGNSSKVYHKTENCRGLKFCSSNIEKISEESAIKLGRRKCKIEKN